MHLIAAASNPGLTAQPLPMPPGASTTDAATGAPRDSGDLLAAMNPAMDAAFAVGRPTNAQGAAAILATTGAYIAGANATIDKLDQGIARREKELEQLRLSDPDAAAKKEAELELLRKLRDRIQLSIERVSRTAAGDDVEGDDERLDEVESPAQARRRREHDIDERLRVRREELELLEQRRALLAPSTLDPGTMDSGSVASTYAAHRRAG